MTCEDALVLLSGHLDGENSEEEEAQLSAHLRQCPACRELLAAFQAADQGILSLEEEPPQTLRQEILDAAYKEPRQKRRVRATRWALPVAAAAVLAIFFGTKFLPMPGVQSTDTAAVSYDAATPRAVAEDSVDAASTEAAQPETAEAEPDFAADMADAAVPNSFLAEAPAEAAQSPAEAAKALAEERGAAVLVLETMDDALEALPTEAYGGMTVITLPDAQALSALQESHPEATLVEPTNGTATAYLALIEAP